MEVIMPKMGESVSEGTIIKWHKKVGDKVKHDEIIFEISTDKVDTEIPSPGEGTLSEILFEEGDTVDVGTVVAKISDDGESKDLSEKKDEEDNGEQKSEVKEEKSENVKKETDSQKSENEKKETSSEKSTSKKSSGKTVDIEMPKMGESVMEGTIIKWFKKVGDKVKKDETIFEISTDKVDTEIPSPEEGTIVEILVGEQETVEVGTIVAKLGVGEDIKIEKKETSVQIEKSDENKSSMHDQVGKDVNIRPKEQGTGSGFYSPLVLNIAQKENVSFDELKNIEGSGHEGRLTKKDILAYIEKLKSKPEEMKKTETSEKKQLERPSSPEITPSVKQASYSSTDVERIPMDNIRQKIMEHMLHSRDTSVHVSALIEVDMTKIHNFIQLKKDEIQKRENVKLTYMAFIANACVRALKKYPLVNSAIDGNTILQKKFINLGIAVAIEPTGLIVPNIKGAGERNITGLAKAISDLAFRSRNKKLTPDDITNGTFTITNYGVFGTIFGTPIINQPEVAILGVGAIQKKPVVIEVDGADTFAIRHIMSLTLSHDHRLVDGMLGGLFLKYIKETLENFEPEGFN
ncbi:MAG TPA: 2-oxoglutarate dehydrogenase, E2 component, dihydrolipoamide succinyltransferase [Ignavibacteriaceae bacterium]|nr:2-oxoglutarate dehydrogenase, E2 component, dihydrolipoamide succinyltransferase [Ignavibacteriaceae bacterium]